MTVLNVLRMYGRPRVVLEIHRWQASVYTKHSRGGVWHVLGLRSIMFAHHMMGFKSNELSDNTSHIPAGTQPFLDV